MKRCFDVLLALILVVLLLPVACCVALLLKLESPGSALTRAHRVGRHGRMVKVWEFRVALLDPDALEMIGGCHDEQLTRIGALLRDYGWARWPWLLSVLKGDFSIVGPRPELPRYVGVYPSAKRKLLLSIKPGLVDLASVDFLEERSLLAGLEGDALEEAYVEQVLPRRLDYGQQYCEGRGWRMDGEILLRWLIGRVSWTKRFARS